MPLFSSATVLSLVDAMAILLSQAYRLVRACLAGNRRAQPLGNPMKGCLREPIFCG